MNNINWWNCSCFTVDVQPPVISNCPIDFTQQAPNGAVRTTVVWTVPTAVDDSGFIASAYNNYNPGDILPIGTTEVIYGFVDESGNEAICSFIVTVFAGKNIMLSKRILLTIFNLDTSFKTEKFSVARKNF